MADTSLIWNIIARDKTTAVLNKLQARAGSVGKTMAAALGPALLPAAAAGTGAIMSVGAAMAGAGVAAGVFGAVTKSAMAEVSEGATKFNDLTDKMALYDREAKILAAQGKNNAKVLKKKADAALELSARLANLPPSTRAATMEYVHMQEAWKGFVEDNKPAVFNLMASGYSLMKTAIGQLQPFFDMASSAANRLFGRLKGAVEGGMLQRLAATAGPALRTLTSIIINVATAVTRMFGRMGAAQGQGILNWIEKMTRRWAEWASSTERGTGINKFIDYVKTNGPQVAATLANFAAAAMHIAQAVAPLAPISMAIASALSSFIQAIPPGVLTTLVAGWLAFNTAMRLYALGSAIATAAQWAMNSALLANPITWIVLAVIALIAVIVLVATKTRFFQTIWEHVWGFMKAVGAWFAGPFASFFKRTWEVIKVAFNMAKQHIGSAVDWIKGKFLAWVNFNVTVVRRIIDGVQRVVSFVRSAPGKMAGALRNMFAPLWNGFRGFVNRIISGWNRLSFGIPGFSFAGISVPGIHVGTPDIPYLATGAAMVKESGLAVIHRGESITPAARVTPYRSTAGGGGGTIVIKSDGSRLSNFLLELLREAIRDKGNGDVVKTLTPR